MLLPLYSSTVHVSDQPVGVDIAAADIIVVLSFLF